MTTSSLTCLLAFFAGLCVAQSTSKNALPEIGVVASDAISLDKELQVGDIFMRQLRGQAPIVRDPLLEEYIQDLGNRLVSQADDTKFPFSFFLINSQSINAFAFFGGHVGVHTGLVVQASNESELASVLAHEVAHVTQRHIARRIQAQKRASPLQIASLLGGILLAATTGSEGGLAALSAGQAAARQASINYTRTNEQEADRIGMQILARAGYDPNGAVSFFRKLAEQNRGRSTPPPFLLTHPLPESRISDARSRAAGFAKRAVPDSLNFHLARSRILARYYGKPEDNITRFKDQLKKQHYVFKRAAEYGLALSLLAKDQHAKADKIISRLLAQDPENLFYLDTATDIAMAQDKHDQAIELLSKHAERTPLNRVLTLNLANAVLKSGQHERATRLLKDYLLVNPNHMLTLQMLSEAYGESRQMLELHQNQAELYALVAAYPRAIDELHSAYIYADERKLEKQRIRARIEQLREQQDRLKTL